ncbi:MAG: glycoside hydrolase family 172 protein [Armatimonadota bacterium]
MKTLPIRRLLTGLGLAAALALGVREGAAQGLGDLAHPQEGRSRRVTSTFREGAGGRYDRNAPPKGDREERSNFDNFRVAPGETHVLMDEKGPGVITHIWMTFLGPEPQDWAPLGSATHQDMLLRIYWDGSKRPAVEAPVGDFFANCFGKRSEVRSLPVVVEDADSYNCFWHMPFRKSARIEIVNQGEQPVNLLYYNIDWIEKRSLPADTPYFYAQYRQEYPVKSGEDYVVLDTKGKGHYVGTVLAVRTRSPSWFGEGDEKIYIDGEEQPSIWGTGTEDYFLSAWGLKTTSTPFFGVPYFDQWGILGGHTSAYRWHVADPLVFNKGLKVTFEHSGWISPDENPEYRSTSWNEREDDFSSVAFWYQTGTPTFTARAPHARERRLPSLERETAYARDVTGAASHGEGRVVRQQLALYPGPQLLYMPQQQEGAWLEIPFEVKKKEPLRLVLNMTKSYDFGRYQPYLNGVRLGGPIDLYSADVASQEFHLLDFWPDPGRYTLRLECAGKSPQSSGYYLGIESVRLRERRPRVAAMGHDRNKDWKKEPVLYR